METGNTYNFRIINESNHLLGIQYSVSTPNSETILFLPLWRPGRYEEANFAKNLMSFKVTDSSGKALKFHKVSKSSWSVNTSEVKEIKVDYSYFAGKLDAGSTFINENQVFINPVNCCLYTEESMHSECTVKLELPRNFMVATSLPLQKKYTYKAGNFDELADSPILASLDLKHEQFTTSKVKFHLWFHGLSRYDIDTIKGDFEKFIQYQIKIFKSFPGKEFHFIYQLPSYKLYHGVEHLKSTVIALGPGYRLMQPDFYNTFLSISSHELLHVWNVKSIRPIEWYPYRFNEVSISPMGYLAEGVTTYLGDIILLRSKAFPLEEYLRRAGLMITRHLNNYGRFNLSLAQSSVDTWLDGYDSGAPNRKTSIYIKGMMAAFILDVSILKESNGKLGIEDVLYYLYENFAQKNKGVSEKDYQKAIEELSGLNFDWYFNQIVHGVNDLLPMLEDSLNSIGLVLERSSSANLIESRFGLKLKIENGNLLISEIAPDSPAQKANLSISDELVAINGLKVDDNLNELLLFNSEETLQVTLFRENHLKQFHLLGDGKEYYSNYSIKKETKSEKKQKELFKFWSS